MAKANLLSQAIARNSSVAISFPTTEGLRHYRSRFLQEVSEGFWIEAVDEERALIDELIRTEQPCALSFVTGPKKLLFSCPIYQRNDQFPVNNQVTCRALLLPFPQEPREIQRRDWYRVRFSDDQLAEMNVRVWKIPESKPIDEIPSATQLITCTLRDLSASGLGVTVTPRDDKTACVIGQRLRLEITDEGRPLLLDGRVRFLTSTNARFPRRLGIDFGSLKSSMEGRRTLNYVLRMVAVAQRDELRRHRREITEPATQG